MLGMGQGPPSLQVFSAHAQNSLCSRWRGSGRCNGGGPLKEGHKIQIQFIKVGFQKSLQCSCIVCIYK